MNNLFPRLICLFLFMGTGTSLLAQVKIGGQKASAPHPSAVLELSDSAKGFLMPRVSQDQMKVIKSPANGLLVYNSTDDKIYVYRESIKEWKELIMAPLPDYELGAKNLEEWEYRNDSGWVYLRRALGLADTVFYSTKTSKMIFSDRYRYSNSLGQPDFSVDRLGGKWVFKSTASKLVDSLKATAYTTSIVNEIDQAANTFNDFHSGLLVATTKNPKSTQVSSQIGGVNISTIHAGQDTVYGVSGIDNVATINGNGYTQEIWGLNNSARISSNSRNDVLNMYGVRNTISRSALATGRIKGNVYGYLGNMSGLSDKVDGTMYGIFLSSITNGTTRRNYSIYTNRGLNRFGDSVLVTDNFSAFPRAVFDINSSSAMIMPNGTTAQRPATNVQGMLRYNNTTNGPEYNDGSSWLGISSGEWKFNPGNNNIELYRPLAFGDSIFYRSANKHFLFSDRATYTNSLGSDFNSDDLGGKFTFKSTASKTQDSTSSASYTGSFIREVDNAVSSLNDFHSGLLVATTVNPKSFQTTSQVQGINVSTIHAGQDTVYQLNGFNNTSSVNGNGYTENVLGLSNNVRILSNSTNGVGSIFGMRNSISRIAGLPGMVDGSIYGYLGTMTGFSGKISGNMYGVFLGNVMDAAPGKNYALFTNRGVNRFGDSVVISDNFAALPRAVLDVNSTSAMIMPNGTTAQRPATNVQGMLRYNNTMNGPEYNDGSSWLGISSGEWKFNSGNNNIELTRPLASGDSIFYRSANRHFLFSDRATYTNSLGSDFNSDDLGGKFTFKSTASKTQDIAGSAPYTGSFVREVDNADNSYSDFHSGLLVATTVNPKSFQTSSQVQGINASTIHAGQDTAYLLNGITNTSTINGNGYTETVFGFSNNVRMLSNSTNGVGSIFGIRNSIARVAGLPGVVDGNVFGYNGSMTGFAGKVAGNMYGFYLGNVLDAGAGKNFAVFTNRGSNRFGDSVLITNLGFVNPRAIFDINSNSAMIIPTGTTADRPAAAFAGMVRYNSSNGGNLETYSGTEWSGIIRNSQSIDIPNITANGNVSVFITVTGATIGSAVYASPSMPLPAAIVIAWARVSAANTVEIGFNNVSGTAVDPPAQNFSIRVIQ